MLSGLRSMEGGDTLLPFVSECDLCNIFGRTTKRVATPFLKGKGENKATPSTVRSGTTPRARCSSGVFAAHRTSDCLSGRHIIGLSA